MRIFYFYRVIFIYESLAVKSISAYEREWVATMTTQQERKTVGILIFADVEVLDFCGPFEVFASTRPPGVPDDEQQLFNVVTIAEHADTISCRGGLLVKPHFTIDEHPFLDILVIPGGAGTRREVKNQQLLAWIARQHLHTTFTTSVCTGAFLLAELGLLDQHQATTHWGSIARMQQSYPAITVLDDARVVDEGHLITSAGISAGIDMSLYVVALLHGVDVAEQTARSMEYDWHTRESVAR